MLIVCSLLACSFLAWSQAPSARAAADLTGRTWQLVQFESSNGKTLIPTGPSKYTIIFQPTGQVSVRIDCNRGRGTWKSTRRNQLQFGPLALTRAMCSPAPLNDRIARDWSDVRSYTLKGGHLFLALRADGGIYEYEPQTATAAPGEE
jgi:para-nitrobenzyl esterase